MKCLCLDCIQFSYKCIKKLDFGDELDNEHQKTYKNICVCFVSIDKEDSIEDLEYIRDIITNIENSLVCIYPYIHLTATPKNEKAAKEYFNTLTNSIKNKFVITVPFGWKKTFKLELSKEINSENFFDSVNKRENIEKVTKTISDIKLVDKNFNELSIDGLYYSFLNETISLPIKQDFAESIESTDVGNYFINPFATQILICLQQYIRNIINSIPYIKEVKTPIILNFKTQSMKTYLKRFPARLYMIKEQKELGLRFATCPHMFTWFKNKFLDYRNLPVGLFEFAECFRLEQKGEVKPLERHRQFTMPDMHILVPNEHNQVIKEFLFYLNLTLKFIKDFNFSRIVPVIRLSKKLYEKEFEFIKKIVKTIEIPCLIETWDEVYYYFDLKYELNYITENKKAIQLSTVQIDCMNSNTYSIKYNNHPISTIKWTQNLENRPVILHASLTGSLERVLRAIYENKSIDLVKPIKLLVIFIDRVRDISYLKNCKLAIHTITEKKSKLSEFIKNLKTQSHKSVANYILIGDVEENNEFVEVNNFEKIQKINKKELCNYFNTKYSLETIFPYKNFKI